MAGGLLVRSVAADAVVVPGATWEVSALPETARRSAATSWGPLYRAGAVSAGLAVLLYGTALVLVVVTAAPPVSDGAKLLEYIDAHRTLYVVRQLLWLAPGIFLMVTFLALAVALRHQGRSFAVTAGLIAVASWALSLAVPTTGDGSLALVLLSDKYADATTAAGKAPFVAGAEVLIALNDVPAVLGFLQTLGVLLVSLLMLRGTFSKGFAWLGLATGVIGILSELFRPVLGWSYAIYGVLLFAWLAWAAFALWRVSPDSP
ncbi:hypothetical protein QRX60_44540 [Amycolatopsis mongoliensis]|uniref:DUF4386 family protein n=1 Tax=Amycolatopsis mongoliensis TaxID=715475 RepID=A0A9Y2NGP9_9PSEU|nr:hypothetical protein [Amycolatopsis sp. 4-36]WIY01034.1 hypothetical protein QRX60_44540 [Amycolatopsis sp. 4-36]